MTRKHLVRIALLTLGCALYLPAMVLMTIQVAGPIALQALFDWLAGRCASDCNGWNVLATAIQIGPIIVTGPVLAWIGIIWIRRGRRSDREAEAIAGEFDKASARVSPHAIEEDEDRYLYRDRQGRLRQVYAPPPYET
ncbi:hypothetical protein [Sphingomonas asaccharolytica]|uniref:hypothetical protein n=1 Tax=Sphingomonas asaccharolytica TaxID=40681 RepID=UPI00082FD114|nr:hypothetical protein [Sphingomonas asaccharolytica]